MLPSRESRRPHIDPRWIAVGLLVVLGLSLRAALAWQPLDQLIGNVADDMFYYLSIARNVAEGRGVTFDGMTPTNGFHPLYLLLTSALHRLELAPETQVRAALLLLAIASALTGLLVFGIVRRLASFPAALVALAWWELNLEGAFVALTGVEVALAVLLVAAATWLWIRIHARPAEHPRQLLLVGLLAGLAMTARTDTVFFAGPLLLAVWVRHPAATRLRGTALYAVGAALPVAPWLLWNVVRFGTLLQDSARALTFRSHSHLQWRLSQGVDVDLPSHLARKLQGWLGELVGTQLGLGYVGGWIAVALILALLLAPLPVRRWRGRGPTARTLSFLWSYAAIATLFYPLYFWFRQSWYLHGSLFALTIAGGLAFERASRLIGARRPLRLASSAVIAALFIALSLASLQRLQREAYPWQHTYLSAARSLRHGLPADVSLGAFNAGILAYFSGHTVVNLDGVVNRDALDALRTRTLLRYLHRREISYLLDLERYLNLHSVWAEPEYPRALQRVALFGREGKPQLHLVRVRGGPAGDRR